VNLRLVRVAFGLFKAINNTEQQSIEASFVKLGSSTTGSESYFPHNAKRPREVKTATQKRTFPYRLRQLPV